MKLVTTPLAEELLQPAIREAARHGWLLQSTAEIRCGFGGVLRQIEVPALDEGVDTSELFREITCDWPQYVSAFASVPFSRTEQFTFTIPRITVIFREGDAPIAVHLAEDNPRSFFTENESLITAPRAVRLAYEPSPDSYATAVAEAVEHLRRGDLSKVVLARSCHGEFSSDVTGDAIAARLHTLEPTCTIYSLPTTDGYRFVGASPELLVSVDSSSITCHPLAGTISTEGVEDSSTYSTWLLGSSKNRVEHKYVIDDIVERLGVVGTNVVADPEPTIVRLRSVTHLGSHIRAHRLPHVTSIDALSSLHPTPAVGGLPRAEAVSLIEKLEARPRGSYAGAVGWCSANGEGSWWVAIRGISFRRREFTLWAGAGIVADSDPIAEREETRNKLDSVLRAIGVGTLN